jgi:four helix bundle protein
MAESASVRSGSLQNHGSIPSFGSLWSKLAVRGAATSIAANIAEGFKKRGAADKVRFFNIAQGSLEECQYYLILARDLGYADTTATRPQLDKVAKILEAYASAILAPNS